MSGGQCGDGVHAGFSDTGQRGTNPNTGATYEVHRCQCGQRSIEVYR